jgi:uncharacterized protein YbaR (Trm112 family)
MPADRSKPVTFNPEIVNQLACPACHGPLRLEATALVCAYCGRQYPVVDGIPVLIVNRVLGADS